ncbi:MAG TPA: DUF4136 domain-containing protein [Caldimonas sp.]|nr:DUF4136 domain-containing protein [Caldimonas sp.]
MRSVVVALVVVLLGGCASMHRLDNEVSAWSRWPAARQPQTYVFERLPSQQEQPQAQQLLEDAARPALNAAGFELATDPSQADVTVQIGARIAAIDRSPFDDPYWWGPGWYRPYGYYARGARAYWGPYGRYGWGWGLPVDDYAFEREVAVLIRDRSSGEPLYEAHALSDGFSPMADSTLPAMFRAALHDFPHGATPNPHRVTVDLRTAN